MIQGNKNQIVVREMSETEIPIWILSRPFSYIFSETCISKCQDSEVQAL